MDRLYMFPEAARYDLEAVGMEQANREETSMPNHVKISTPTTTSEQEEKVKEMEKVMNHGLDSVRSIQDGDGK